MCDDFINWFISCKNAVNSELLLFFITIGIDLLSLIVLTQEKALTRAWITDFRFHDLRHTFASHYIMSGGDMLSLKEILGHSNMKIVKRYTHLASAHKHRQINNLKGKFSICHPNATARKTA
ncbi:MAG: tyrosine-type recombinase/integrase [Syntrophaceae bacterium]|nr:tyrosine-type recombinase/integrase [Syntrophaceae bacterium]